MYDNSLLLKDAGAVTESGVGTVGGVARILDVGEGLAEGEMVVDVTAIEIASNDELYSIALQGSDVADFTTGSPKVEELACLNLGANEVLSGNQDSATGRYVVPFSNLKLETYFPYLRLYSTCAGSVATGINFSAFLR